MSMLHPLTLLQGVVWATCAVFCPLLHGTRAFWPPVAATIEIIIACGPCSRRTISSAPVWELLLPAGLMMQANCLELALAELDEALPIAQCAPLLP